LLRGLDLKTSESWAGYDHIATNAKNQERQTN
jgi:hypothetical protein